MLMYAELKSEKQRRKALAQQESLLHSRMHDDQEDPLRGGRGRGGGGGGALIDGVEGDASDRFTTGIR